MPDKATREAIRELAHAVFPSGNIPEAVAALIEEEEAPTEEKPKGAR